MYTQGMHVVKHGFGFGFNWLKRAFPSRFPDFSTFWELVFFPFLNFKRRCAEVSFPMETTFFQSFEEKEILQILFMLNIKKSWELFQIWVISVVLCIRKWKGCIANVLCKQMENKGQNQCTHLMMRDDFWIYSV